MLSNPCIHYPAPYEATPAAIFMAGLFLAFLVEYLGQRVVLRRQKQAVVQAQTQTQAQAQGQHQHQHNGVDEEAAPAAPAAAAPPHPTGAGVRQDSAATTTGAEERKESSVPHAPAQKSSFADMFACGAHSVQQGMVAQSAAQRKLSVAVMEAGIIFHSLRTSSLQPPSSLLLPLPHHRTN